MFRLELNRECLSVNELGRVLEDLGEVVDGLLDNTGYYKISVTIENEKDDEDG